jgi:hypothetical protein
MEVSTMKSYIDLLIIKENINKHHDNLKQIQLEIPGYYEELDDNFNKIKLEDKKESKRVIIIDL